MEQKAHLTVQFLKYKVQEYERLRAEIEVLQREAEQKDCWRRCMSSGHSSMHSGIADQLVLSDSYQTQTLL